MFRCNFCYIGLYMLLTLQRIARVPAAVMAVLLCLFIVSGITERCCAHSYSETHDGETACHTASSDKCDDCTTAASCSCESDATHHDKDHKESQHECNDCISCCLCAASLISGSTYSAIGLIPIQAPRPCSTTLTTFTITDAPPVPPPNLV